ncbi:ATP-dependent DNA ligase [Burkholderia phage vB_BglM_WTB]
MSKMQKPMKGDQVEIDKAAWPKMVSAKYDGYRAYNDGLYVLHTSSGAPVSNRHTQALFNLREFAGFDGELIVGEPNLHDTYTNTSGPVRREAGEPDVYWYVFDDRSKPDAPYAVRYLRLIERVSELRNLGVRGADRIIVVPHTTVNDELQYLVLRDQIIGNGYEGAMLRDPKGRYKFGRSSVKEGLLNKDKPWEDTEGIVVGFEERMHNTNTAEVDNFGNTKRSNTKDAKAPTGMVGKFLVESPRWPGQTLKIATGPLKHPELKRAFEDFDSLWKGKQIVFRFLPSGGYELPRHPQLKGLRGAEDMS